MNLMNLGLPLDLTWYKLLTDWGSLIGGGFALIAGIVGYAHLADDPLRLATERFSDKIAHIGAKAVY